MKRSQFWPFQPSSEVNTVLKSYISGVFLLLGAAFPMASEPRGEQCMEAELLHNWKLPQSISQTKYWVLLFLSLSYYFFFLLYLQTLIFLAENRKPYQIGITVLLAIVFSPKTGWLWASSESHLLCTHRPIRSQKKKTKKGESPGLLILKQRVVAWELHAFDKGWPRGHVHDREQRVWGALHYSWWPCWPCLCYP